MTTKHTPGSWALDVHNNSLLPDKLSKINIVQRGSCHNTIKVIASIETDYPNEENEANAKLIAAAPRMLEGIDETINRLQQVLSFYNIESAARDIINGEITALQSIYAIASSK